MPSFKFDISPKEEVFLDLALDVQRELNAAYTRRAAEGVTKTDLAKKIGTNKSTITRVLSQASNLTLETIGCISWALDHIVTIKVIPVETAYAGRNSRSHFVNIVPEIDAGIPAGVSEAGAAGTDNLRVVKPVFA